MNQRSTPDPPGFYYGWVMVVGLAAVGMVAAGMGGVNFGLFIPSMSKDLGISQVFFGWAYSARLIGFSVTGWYLGRVLDRHGARIPLAVAGALLGCVMAGLAALQAAWQLIALFFLLGMIGLEGGGGNLYLAVPLSRWFVRKRGKAMSMAALGTTMGILLFSPLSEYLIARYGWRASWLILGASGSIIMILIALCIIRKDPQSMGFGPDGEPLADKDSKRSGARWRQTPVEYSWSLESAIRSRTFWALVVIHGLRMFSVSTMIVFRIPFFIQHGVSSKLVAWAISVEAVIASFSSILAGRAVDRFNSRVVVVVALIVFIATFIVTINFATTFHVFLATALYGISASAYVVAQNSLWPDYFGSLHIGSIRGFSLLTTLVFSIIGAPLTGAVKDATGSYVPAWIFSLICLAVATVLMWITKKPTPNRTDLNP